jgi:High potential iron-sulfur protein
MTGKLNSIESRRAFLKLSRHAVLVPIFGISACGKPDPASQAANGSQRGMSAGDIAHVDQNDPSAKSLGYYQDAAAVDPAKYPQHLSGQTCWKCVLFKGGANDAWGPCVAFAGKLVSAQGWCTAFAAKA